MIVLNKSYNKGKQNANYSHGMRHTRFYKIWVGMKMRCNNSNQSNYNNYGGRGISYQKSWEEFIPFYKDMYSSYKDDLYIERINNDKGYTKRNCKWATRKEQNNNTRKTLNIKYEGKNYKIFELAKKFNIPIKLLYSRLHNHKIAIEDALQKKYKKRKPFTLFPQTFSCKDCGEQSMKKGTRQTRCSNCKKEHFYNYHMEYNKKRLCKKE